MSEYNLRELLLSGHAPKHVKLLMAQGAVPLPAQEALELLVHLGSDDDEEISQQATETLNGWDESEIIALLRLRECPAIVLDFFADIQRPEHILQTILVNPSVSGETVARLAAAVSPALLDVIMDNRTRILESPAILEGIRRNPSATARVLGLAHEIETGFLEEKRKDYSIETAGETEAEAGEDSAAQTDVLDFEAEIAMLLSSPPPDIDLSLDGLLLESVDGDDSNISSRISTMPVRDKLKYAVFGTRELRAILIRDTNREVARAVLRSPKLKENEVETISAMRNVAEYILREIGNNRDWLKNTIIVNNLVKNPKTPSVIAQRLMPRLRTQELAIMARDRSLPDATRNNAKRLVKQRESKTGG